MALNYVTTKLSLLENIFQPTIDALFSRLPLTYRWRVLLLQPITLLSVVLTSPAWLFNSRTSVLYVPTRSGRKRCLVYQPARPRQPRGAAERGGDLRPLHVDAYGGGFIGGFPEQNARFCSLLSDSTGAVVVSCSYRAAPRYTFPAAHDDVEDVVRWVVAHAEQLGADAQLLTVGGSSVGGNLTLSAAQSLYRTSQSSSSGEPSGGRPEQSVVPRAFVGFYTPTNFRLRPQEKPRPPNYPTKDPLSFLLPLYDSYAGPNRERDWENARLHPIIAKKEELPPDMLFIAAGIDILLHEQLTLVERLRGELEAEGDTERRIEIKVWEKGFHGWLERKCDSQSHRYLY